MEMDKCRILEEAILNVAESHGERQEGLTAEVNEHAVAKATDELSNTSGLERNSARVES